MRTLASIPALACVTASVFAATAHAKEVESIVIVQPGGGLWIADGVSEIPLDIIVRARPKTPNIRKAIVAASVGKVSEAQVIGPHRARVYYLAPLRKRYVDEIIDVSLTLDDGNTLSEAFTLQVPKERPPTVQLRASTTVLPAESLVPIELEMEGEPHDGSDVVLAATSGSLSVAKHSNARDAGHRTLTLERVPPDAPSHLLVLGVAKTATGYSARVEDISIVAPIRLSFDIPPGSQLVVEGGENRPAPVTAPADGRTVMENVIVRHGAALQAFAVRGREKRPLSVVVPTGVVAAGVVAEIPGQAFADGGTGPSIVLAIPPPALGGALSWPAIAVEGAELLKTVQLSPRVRALIVRRPRQPADVTVRLDDVAIGIVRFAPLHGQQGTLELAKPRSEHEVAALELGVENAEKQATDLPWPRVRIDGRSDIDVIVDRVGVGKYHIGIPATAKIDPATPALEVVAEIPPPALVAGDAIEIAAVRKTIALRGPAGGRGSTEIDAQRGDATTASTARDKLAIGVAGAAFGGTAFHAFAVYGGGISVRLGLPMVLDGVGAQAGAEFLQYVGSGDGIDIAIGVLAIPIEAYYAFARFWDLELTARAGGAIRIEWANVTTGGESLAGGSQVALGARAAVELGYSLAVGTLFASATLEGIGATADGLSTETTRITGDLTNLRGELGFRVWP